MERAFQDEGVMIRVAGETIALSPPLIVTGAQIDQIVDKVGRRRLTLLFLREDIVGLAAERPLAGQRLVQHDADRVPVARLRNRQAGAVLG